MAKSLIVISITVLLAALAIDNVNADCCVPMWVQHVCDGIPNEVEIHKDSLGPLYDYLPKMVMLFNAIDENEYWIREDADRWKVKCISRFCHDGTPLLSGNYCGNGECNMFGCACEGGCRSKEGVTEETITDAFVKAHNFTSQATHKLLPF